MKTTWYEDGWEKHYSIGKMDGCKYDTLRLELEESDYGDTIKLMVLFGNDDEWACVEQKQNCPKIWNYFDEDDEYYARFEPIREISFWKNPSLKLEKEMKSMEDFLLKIFKGN